MHVHLPKPLHGWREFLGEVGIIVIGVLIALGAEQVVEAIHWRHEASDARDAIRAELVDDNLPQAYARIAITPCLVNQLDKLQSALDAHTQRPAFAALADAYTAPNRTWDEEAWKAAVSSGVLAHNGSDELIRWSLPYRLVGPMGDDNHREGDDWTDLRSLSHAPGKLTTGEVDRVTVALVRLRRDVRSMYGRSQLLISAAKEAGVRMSERQHRAVLAQVRREWGDCIREPVLTGNYSAPTQR